MAAQDQEWPRQMVGALGYGSVFLPPVLMVASAWFNIPWLTFGTVMLAFPMMRTVFGAVPAGDAPEWRAGIAAALDRIGVGYAIGLAVAVAALLARLHVTPVGPGSALGWALSLWAVLVFATCVAHDLLHRRDPLSRLLGHIVAGGSGYPLLGYEHNRHHKLKGNTAAAEWPRESENVWGFTVRRLVTLLPETLGPEGLLLAGSSKSAVVRGLRVASVSTLATAAVFAAVAGATGLVMYAGVVVLVSFAIQLVTYLQHWGLGDDSCPDARLRAYSWESDCRFQAWVTLNLSLHQAHHENGSVPYYRTPLAPQSPRLPMGYVLLMFVAFVPPLWRRVMGPALAYWKAQPASPLSSGRRLTCIALYR